MSTSTEMSVSLTSYADGSIHLDELPGIFCRILREQKKVDDLLDILLLKHDKLTGRR